MILQFLGIPLRWEYRGYMYTMWFLGYVPTMGLSQFVYVFCSFRTAVLDFPLIWACQLLCMVLSDHTSVSYVFILI